MPREGSIKIPYLHKAAFPKKGARNYIANGEIGIACGDYEINRSYKNNYMHVEFSSQPNYKYSFDKSDFNEENGTAQLELAYGLTVHKAQGSQFGTVILVLADPCLLLSKEMLYTALSRQTEKIVILYNQEPYHLMKFSSDKCSDIKRRFTDLFASVFLAEGKDLRPEDLSKVGNTYFDDKKIHKTAKGELVQSKSEVSIANAMYYQGIDYEYEKPISIEGRIKFPDFTIEDGDTGIIWYWEHCGVMTDPHYKKRWEDKKAFYAKNGIVEGKNLIVTYDNDDGGIDTELIDKIIKETFLD